MDLVVAFTSVVLGVVEGLTGFPPITSTGHPMVTGLPIGSMRGEHDREFRRLDEVVLPFDAIPVRGVAFGLLIAAPLGVMAWMG
jgi:undecaprenyl pyrophosphate phosphatase UppP